MYFKDKKHKDFYEDTLKQIEEIQKSDVYYRSLIYTLGISQVTRKHMHEIFDLVGQEIHVDSIGKNWQTSNSKKVTELAFNLWNDFSGQNAEDSEKGNCQVSHIFGCSYAPYFYEAIKLRFPEYTKTAEKEEDM